MKMDMDYNEFINHIKIMYNNILQKEAKTLLNKLITT